MADHDREVIARGRGPSCLDTCFFIRGAGSKVRPRGPSIPDDPSQLFYDEQLPGFADLEFDGKTLVFEFIDKFGAVSYTLILPK